MWKAVDSQDSTLNSSHFFPVVAPFSDFTYFGLLLYIALPTLALGLLGRANRRWTLIATALVGVLNFSDDIAIRPGIFVHELWIALGFALYQGVLAAALLRWKSKTLFRVLLVLSILPLAAAKFLPVLAPGTLFGFLGISYVTFRSLDVLFSVHDGILKSLSPGTYLAFLFFWPTVSSGPIDRYRRFVQDLDRRRTRAEFFDDLDVAVERIFRGFLYKFLIAALLSRYCVDPIEHRTDAFSTLLYMYGYSLYLFFDFAGYSAFAIGFSRLFGIRSPENFDLPFLSRNIRDFWNRWHISLSFWFRDHIYMRFLIAASKGKWFKGKHTASYLGLWLTFGLMGVWHGIETHYLLYGAYHAALLCGYDAFARWNKSSKRWPDTPFARWLNIAITFHAVCFGLLIFSGKLTAHPAAVVVAPQ